MEQPLKYYRDFPPDLKWLRSMRPMSVQRFPHCVSEILVSSPPIVIERLTFRANVEIPRHKHSRVSALEYGVGGSGLIVVNGRKFINGESAPRKLPIYLPKGRVHSGTVGPDGAVCISVQYWYESPLMGIGFDWEDA